MARLRKRCYANRSENGEELTYNRPKDLLQEAYKYFEWCGDNPWYRQELIKSGSRAGELIEVPVVRPFTIEGLCVFCGISVDTFCRYETMPDFGQVTVHLREIIRQNQIEGECVGAYNAAVIGRMHGATVRQELDVSSGLTINVISPEAKNNLEALKESLSE